MLTKQLKMAKYLIPRRGCVTGPAIESYERAFADAVGAKYAVGFWKGRVAFYAALRALDLREGDEIIMPAYTCLVIPAAAVRMGVRPVYVDIEPAYCSIDPERIEAAITPRTRALMIQHTYGWPTVEIDRVVAIAAKAGIHVIEDCCHALGTRVHGRHVGNFGKAAFFSSQWSKPFTTGLGGLLVLNDEPLYQRVRSLRDAEARRPSATTAAQLALQCMAFETLVYPGTITASRNVYRWLGSKSVITVSTSKTEYAGAASRTAESDGFFTGISQVQASAGLFELNRLDESIAFRRKLGHWYAEVLRADGWSVPAWPTDADVTLLRFPVRVANKQEVLAAAASRCVEIGDWFVQPLHSHIARQDDFGYTTGMCPHSDRAAAEIVNLPIHPRVSSSHAEKAVRLLKEVGQRPA